MLMEMGDKKRKECRQAGREGEDQRRLECRALLEEQASSASAECSSETTGSSSYGALAFLTDKLGNSKGAATATNIRNFLSTRLTSTLPDTGDKSIYLGKGRTLDRLRGRWLTSIDWTGGLASVASRREQDDSEKTVARSLCQLNSLTRFSLHLQHKDHFFFCLYLDYFNEERKTKFVTALFVSALPSSEHNVVVRMLIYHLSLSSSGTNDRLR
ncbi:hypothetical protein B566_EDAN013691 [Ephemera danica]|nr:hypothetical protein B566_EDAN013691 [Ephemera danica]